MPELEKMILDANAVNLISLNKKWYETDSYKDVREIDILEDKKGEDPTRRIQKNDLMRLVTKGLNRNERLIIILYYYEEFTMKEIGATLNLSESRVSQMHSSIVQRLQGQLGPPPARVRHVAAASRSSFHAASTCRRSVLVCPIESRSVSLPSSRVWVRRACPSAFRRVQNLLVDGVAAAVAEADQAQRTGAANSKRGSLRPSRQTPGPARRAGGCALAALRRQRSG